MFERLRVVLRDVPSDRMDALVERMEMQDLETVLWKAITESGKTHYAIGKAAGVAPGVLDRFVAGTRGITLATASKIVGVLGYGLVKIDPDTSSAADAEPEKKKAAKKTAKRTPKRK